MGMETVGMPVGGPPQRTCMQRSLPWCGMGCGAVLVVIAWIFGALFVFDSHQSVLHSVVNGQAHTSTSQKFYDAWANHSEAADTMMYYWLWNVSNAPACMASGAKPELDPVGPFVYRQLNTKEKIAFSDDGNMVRYHYRIQFLFDQERSGAGLTEQTQVYMPNLPMFGAYWRSSNAGSATPPWGGPPQDGKVTSLNTLGLAWQPPPTCGSACLEDWRKKEIVNYTAHQWLWNVSDPVVVSLDGALRNLLKLGLDFGVRIQPGDMISLQFNNTADLWNHTSSQWTGKDSTAKAGKMVHWEGCNTIGDPGKCGEKHQYWGQTPAVDCAGLSTAQACAEGEARYYCEWDQFRCADPAATGCCQPSAAVRAAAYVNGTDGYQQAPNMKSGNKYDVFLDQAWRRFDLAHAGDCEYNGISSCSRYVIDDSNFENETQSEGANGGYLPSRPGLLNFTTVQAAPIYLSRPFFKGAADSAATVDQRRDPAWPEACKDPRGVAVDSCLDPQMESEFQYETWTGLGLSAAVGLQINIRVRDVSAEWETLCGGQCDVNTAPNTSDHRVFTKGMQEAYYPMLTIKQVVGIRDHYVHRLKHEVLYLVNGVILASKIILPIFTVLGGVLIFFSVRTLLARKAESEAAVYDRLGHEEYHTQHAEGGGAA